MIMNKLSAISTQLQAQTSRLPSPYTGLGPHASSGIGIVSLRSIAIEPRRRGSLKLRHNGAGLH